MHTATFARSEQNPPSSIHRVRCVSSCFALSPPPKTTNTYSQPLNFIKHPPLLLHILHPLLNLQLVHTPPSILHSQGLQLMHSPPSRLQITCVQIWILGPKGGKIREIVIIIFININGDMSNFIKDYWTRVNCTAPWGQDVVKDLEKW